MGRKTEEKTLELSDGSPLALKAQQLPALDALRLAARLARVVAPLATSGLKLDQDASALAPVVASMLAQLDGDEVSALARELLKGTLAVRDGKARTLLGDDAINQAFEGEFKALCAALIWAVQVNFRDFFRGTAGAGAAAPAVAAPTALA